MVRKNGNVDHDFASDILTGGSPAWKDRVEIAIPHLAKRERARNDFVRDNSMWRDTRAAAFVVTLTKSCRITPSIDVDDKREEPDGIINV